LLFLSWARFKAVISALASNLTKLASLAIFIVVISLIVQDLSRDLIVIEPISVPRVIADNGLTAEIASRRLRDALGSYARKAGSMMKGPLVSPQSELPDIVVPKIGLSLDSIASSLRSLLHYGTRETVSGELIIRDKLAWLRLRVNGQEVYSSPVGRDLERVDEMFVHAAPALMEKIRPYLVASTIYDEDREEGFKRANSIVAQLPESNIDVEWAYILIGNYYVDTKDYARGKEAFLKAIWINGNNAMAHNNHGAAFLVEGELELAEVEFRRAIKLDPNFALAHLNLGRVNLEQGALDKAAAKYRRAIELDPKDGEAHGVLGDLLRKQGKVDQAAAEYQRAFALDPKNALAHSSFGSVLHEQGKIDEATKEFQRAIELDPKNANLHSALGFILYEQGEFNEAAKECQRAIELDPKNATLHAIFGGLLREQRKPDEAATEYRRAIELDPKNATLHASLGILLHERGKDDEAAKEFQRAIELDPNYALPRYNLSLLLYEQGKDDEAAKEYRRAIELASEDTGAHPRTLDRKLRTM
jgi:tetratricopeptide (TPR) repeat protein